MTEVESILEGFDLDNWNMVEGFRIIYKIIGDSDLKICIIHPGYAIELHISNMKIVYNILGDEKCPVYTYQYISAYNSNIYYYLDGYDITVTKSEPELESKFELETYLENAIYYKYAKLSDKIDDTFEYGPKQTLDDLVIIEKLKNINKIFDEFQEINEYFSDVELENFNTALDKMECRFSPEYRYIDDSGEIFESTTKMTKVDIIKKIFTRKSESEPEFKFKFAD